MVRKIAVVVFLLLIALLILNAESQKKESSADLFAKVLIKLSEDHKSIVKEIIKTQNMVMDTKVQVADSGLSNAIEIARIRIIVTDSGKQLNQLEEKVDKLIQMIEPEENKETDK